MNLDAPTLEPATARPAVGAHHIRPLTGIRGIAAFGVVLYHFHASWLLLMPSLQAVAPLAARGCLGVDLFFLLSGFILTHVYGEGDFTPGLGYTRRFIWFRFARVYPNHLATVAVLGLLMAWSWAANLNLPFGDCPLSGLPYQLTMTHVWPFAQGGLWNYPSWSISAEWFAYLAVFPAAMALFRTLARWRSAGLFLAAGYGFLAAFFLLCPWIGKLPFERPFALPEVTAEFLAGCMFYGACRFGATSGIVCWLQRHASWLCVGVFASAALMPSDWSYAALTLVLLFPVVLIALTSETSRAARFLSTKTWLWLGHISYAIYLSHPFADRFFRAFAPSQAFAGSSFAIRTALLAAHVGMVLLMGAALHYGVELPSRNALRRVKLPWKATPAL